jgi:hypothetical protein
MSDLATTYRPKLDESREDLDTTQQTSTETQEVITEQQVLFSTAAAVALPPAKTRRWNIVHIVSEALRAYFAPTERSSAPRRYPKRHVWLENAAMGREMDRL